VRLFQLTTMASLVFIMTPPCSSVVLTYPLGEPFPSHRVSADDMLLIWLIVQVGSRATFEFGCGGVVYAIHISFTGLTLMFQPAKKPRPLAPVSSPSRPVIAMPFAELTTRLLAPRES